MEVYPLKPLTVRRRSRSVARDQPALVSPIARGGSERSPCRASIQLSTSRHRRRTVQATERHAERSADERVFSPVATETGSPGDATADASGGREERAEPHRRTQQEKHARPPTTRGAATECMTRERFLERLLEAHRPSGAPDVGADRGRRDRGSQPHLPPLLCALASSKRMPCNRDRGKRSRGASGRCTCRCPRGTAQVSLGVSVKISVRRPALRDIPPRSRQTVAENGP